MWLYLGLLFVVAAPVAIAVKTRIAEDTDWGWHETTRGPVMRRRISGKWQIREMTADELHDYEGTRIGW